MRIEKLYHTMMQFVKTNFIVILHKFNFLKLCMFLLDKQSSICYTIIRKRQEDKKMTNFEMEMLSGASLDELLELAGVSKEEFEEA